MRRIFFIAAVLAAPVVAAVPSLAAPCGVNDWACKAGLKVNRATGKVSPLNPRQAPGNTCRTETFCAVYGKPQQGMIAPPCLRSQQRTVCGKFPNPN